MRSALFLIALSISGASAQEQNILPTEYPANRYSRIWENSPFNREVVAQIQSKPRSAFASNFVLEGLVMDETAGSIAYVRDLKEGGYLVVTKKKSPGSGLFLLDAQKGTNPDETVVTISDGKETAEIRYAEGVYTQKIQGPPPPKTSTEAQAANTGALVTAGQTAPDSGGGSETPSNRTDGPAGGAGASPGPNKGKASSGQKGNAPPPASRPKSGIIIPTKPPATSSN